MGAFKYELDERACKRADKLALREFGVEFSHLLPPEQISIWNQAEDEVRREMENELEEGGRHVIHR